MDGGAIASPRTLPPFVGLIAILICAIVFYLRAVNQWFFADDLVLLRASQSTGWGSWFARSWDFRSGAVADIVGYRPLYMLTFHAEYSLFGLHALGYHIVNIIAHLAGVVLFWWVAVRLTKRVWAAHLAALVFAVNPSYDVAVEWVASGNAVMATTLSTAAILSFMKYADGGPRRLLHLAGTFFAFVASILYHPLAIPILGVLPLWYFLVKYDPSHALRPRSWLPFLPLVGAVMPVLLIQRWMRSQDPIYTGSYAWGPHVGHNYFDYFSLSIYPVPYTHGDPPIAGLVMLGICLMLLLVWRWSTAAPFAVIWFCLALAPGSLLTLGASMRMMYSSGMPLALCFALVAMLVSDVLYPRLRQATTLVTADHQPMRLPQGAYTAMLLAPVAILLAPAVVLLSARHEAREGPNKASAEARHLERQLREQFPTLPSGGTLYVANAPASLTFLRAPKQAALTGLVQLYYGDIRVKVVPLEEAPYWNETQVRAALLPDDRLFVFDP